MHLIHHLPNSRKSRSDNNIGLKAISGVSVKVRGG